MNSIPIFRPNFYVMFCITIIIIIIMIIMIIIIINIIINIIIIIIHTSQFLGNLNLNRLSQDRSFSIPEKPSCSLYPRSTSISFHLVSQRV